MRGCEISSKQNEVGGGQLEGWFRKAKIMLTGRVELPTLA